MWQALKRVFARTPAPHPIFSKFTPFTGTIPGDELDDYIGARFRRSWVEWPTVEPRTFAPAPPPKLDEELFEWIDILSAVDTARDEFVMVELGAGYGRWSFRAAEAARQRGLKTRLVLVEADPKHIVFIDEAIALNAHPLVTVEVQESAIGYDGPTANLACLMPDETPGEWYGQAVILESLTATDELYCGRVVSRSPSRYGYIEVQSRTLEQAIGHLPRIDLIDMDLQGAELALLRNSMAIMDERVRRVHLGTHSQEIEQTAREQFTAHGWTNVWDFGLAKQNQTPWGPCHFIDGVSSWINPRLENA